MKTALSDIVFGDPLVTALENRAHREGILTDADFKLSEFVQPTLPSADVNEAIALDLMCLYDHVVAEGRRYDFRSIQRAVGDDVVLNRGENIREFTLALGPFRGSEFSGVTKDEFQALRASAAQEAQFILRRDIDFYLRDAKRQYESEVPRREWKGALLADDMTHEAVARFLKRNMFWLVDVFDFAFGDGVYNRFVEVDDLEIMGLPKDDVRAFAFCIRRPRFDAYFSYIQEAYTSLYENSFLGRSFSIDAAYERAPDRHLPASPEIDMSKVSRLLRVNLADVIDYFPLPRTLEEAAEFRHHPKVDAFKKALSRWMKSCSSEPMLEAKLRRDLRLASRDLRLLRSWREIRSRPLFFGVKTTAQMVPILGTVVTALDVIEYFVEQHVGRRWAWVVLPQEKLGSFA